MFATPGQLAKKLLFLLGSRIDLLAQNGEKLILYSLLKGIYAIAECIQHPWFAFCCLIRNSGDKEIYFWEPPHSGNFLKNFWI